MKGAGRDRDSKHNASEKGRTQDDTTRFSRSNSQVGHNDKVLAGIRGCLCDCGLCDDQMVASGMEVAIHVKTLTLVSFVLAMVYYWIVRLLEDSMFLWFLVVIFGAFAVSFGPGFVI